MHGALNVAVLTVRGDLEKERGVTLPRPKARSSSAAGCTILPLCWAAPRCVCVRPALLPLQLLPQAFAVNKNVFSVDLPGYIRVEMLLLAKFQVMKCYFPLRSKIHVSIDWTLDFTVCKSVTISLVFVCAAPEKIS